MKTKTVRITQKLFSMVTGEIHVGTQLILHQVESGTWQIAEPTAWRGVVIPDDCFVEAVKFTEEDVKSYLDEVIRFWRKQRDSRGGRYYIDAYQTIRYSLFGELLPEEESDDE